MSQLGLGLGLTRGGGVPFNPLSLNPYLLFDTRSSMIGTFENPTLDLDPSKPDTLNVITATRSGTATYTDAAGLIQTASPDTVRVDHVDGVPMILVEPSATNLVEYSEDFSNPYWTKSAILIDSNQTEAPNGSIVADKLMEEGVNQTHLVFKAAITDLGTISVYAKQGDANNRLFQIRRDGGSNSWSWFDLQAGTVEYQTQGVASIEDAGNGWHRCTFTPTNSNGTVVFGLSNGGLTRSESYQGDGTSGVYIWGAQVEAGSVATSYIPTTSGSTATRQADDLVITGSAFSDFYNQSEGTIYAEFVPKLESLDATLFNFSDGSNFNRIMSLTKFYHIFVTTSGNTQVQFASGSVSLNNLNRLAASLKTNDCVLSLNGSSEVVDSSMAMPSINQINIGARFGGTEQLQGHIRRLLYWPVSSDSL
jgi:hypothetical protein